MRVFQILFCFVLFVSINFIPFSSLKGFIIYRRHFQSNVYARGGGDLGGGVRGGESEPGCTISRSNPRESSDRMRVV